MSSCWTEVLLQYADGYKHTNFIFKSNEGEIRMFRSAWPVLKITWRTANAYNALFLEAVRLLDGVEHANTMVLYKNHKNPILKLLATQYIKCQINTNEVL